MTREEFEAAYASGARDFRNHTDFGNTENLRYLAARDCDFSGRNFFCQDVRYANFRGCNFSDCFLDDARFDHTDLQGANFTDASTRGVTFAKSVFDKETTFCDTSHALISALLQQHADTLTREFLSTNIAWGSTARCWYEIADLLMEAEYENDLFWGLGILYRAKGLKPAALRNAIRLIAARYPQKKLRTFSSLPNMYKYISEMPKGTIETVPVNLPKTLDWKLYPCAEFYTEYGNSRIVCYTGEEEANPFPLNREPSVPEDPEDTENTEYEF